MTQKKQVVQTKKSFANHSAAFRLAMQFSLVIAFLSIFISITVVALLRISFRKKQSERLSQAALAVQDGFSNYDGDFNEESIFALCDSISIPYFTSVLILDEKNFPLYTNDPFVPALKSTDEKTIHYILKDFYIDGDLNVLYRTQNFFCTEKSSQKIYRFTIQTSLNCELDFSERLLAFLPRTFSFILFPLLVLSFLAAFFITKKILHPVRDITFSAQKISASNLKTRLEISHRGDEFDLLCSAFNSLFERLQKDFERERSFTGNVSHELKTPIAVILGQANLLLRWGKNDALQIEKSLSIIAQESRRMEKIVEDLLEISRLENGIDFTKMENFFVPSLLRSIENESKLFAPKLEFDFCDISESAELFSDENLVRRLILIFVSNSQKFCQVENPKITFSFYEDLKTKILKISDNGPGLPQSDTDRIFERFFRGDESHTRKVGGAGLGLALAKQIALALGAKITIDSTKKIGAHFCLIFPKKN